VIKIKITDVAQRAGVSKSTVSQYLNGRFEYMSKETKKRVKAAVDDLNYIPNPIARSLKTDKTKMIGVIVRDITGYDTSRFIRGIHDYCKNSEYNALIYNTDFDPEIEAKSLHALNQLRVEGMLIASSGKNTSIITGFIEAGMQIVQFQIEHDGNEKNIVICDYRQAAFEATEYLIKLGHKRIGFVTQDFQDIKSRRERYLGYVEAHEKYNVPLDKQLTKYWDREAGFEDSFMDILDPSVLPTAFFTQQLDISTELLTIFKDKNISIPDDVSLLAFEEIPNAEFFQVPISVVKQESHKLGYEAAKLLISNIKTKSKAGNRITIPCTLATRDSCIKV
jgi:DNA-binding LacI/PurR family transcriptional regulator